jgi:kinesin family protein 3/17
MSPLLLCNSSFTSPTTSTAHPAWPRFTFDHVYDQDSSQEEVYNSSAKPLVLSTLQGYNAAIIAYGQTGTGKT